MVVSSETGSEKLRELPELALPDPPSVAPKSARLRIAADAKAPLLGPLYPIDPQSHALYAQPTEPPPLQHPRRAQPPSRRGGGAPSATSARPASASLSASSLPRRPSPRTSKIRYGSHGHRPPAAPSAAMMDKMHAKYVAAIARETLLAEAQEQQLALARERFRQLKSAGPPRVGSHAESALDAQLKRMRQRCHTFETRVSEMERIVARLETRINSIRLNAAPHHQRARHTAALMRQRADDVEKLKQQTSRALDQREGLRAALLRMSEEESRERAEAEEAVMRALEMEAALQQAYVQRSAELEEEEELSKRHDYERARARRDTRESVDVRYGYLRNQLAGLDDLLCRLLEHAGAGKASGDDAVRLVIDRLQHREEKIASAHAFVLELSTRHVELAAEIALLERSVATTTDGTRNADDGGNADDDGTSDLLEATPPPQSSRPWTATAPPDDRALERKIQPVIVAIEEVVRAGRRGEADDGDTRVCSVATVESFLAELDSNLDWADKMASRLVGVAETLMARRAHNRAVRPPSFVLERYLEARGSMRPPTDTGVAVVAESALPSVADQLQVIGGADEGASSGKGGRTGRRPSARNRYEDRLHAALARRRPRFVSA